MLELRDIRKQYGEGDSTVHALGGVSLKFRESEFVSILGASGCGKTTLLNIVGGLDRYTSGDLIINGKSTKDFSDSDWDTYRNHSVGFVFQSYNLIPHQSVLSNVELALTLSGVSKSERRARAKEALEKVGLGDQIHKKPNQMSGGQMQRVAIARALVNNPDILLADEPTGALDTTTSVQIMDLLKEVAKQKLVIMVTHNPELAEQYSTRIVRLSDGLVVSDTNPFEDESAAPAAKETDKAKKKSSKKSAKKKSMSFPTAVSLSFNNLLTKKTRTILTSFAGSIGIIGIALILSLSNGIQAYIDRVQEDTLSTYPLTLQKETQDFSAMLATMTEVSESAGGEIDENTIYVDNSMDKMMSAMTATVSNDLEKFKAYLEENYEQIEGSLSDVQYTYDFDLQVFNINEHGLTQVSPTQILNSMGFGDMGAMMGSMGGGMSVLSQMIGNQELLDAQYELVGENSHWPESANEVVLVVSKDNKISTMTLYMLGLLDQDKIPEVMKQIANKEYVPEKLDNYKLDDFLGMEFKLLNTADFYEKTAKEYTVDGETYPIWGEKIFLDEAAKQAFVEENGETLVISGIVRPKEGATATSISGALGYTKALTDKIIALNAESEIIDQQKNKTPKFDVLTGMEFVDESNRVPHTPDNIGELIAKVDDSTMEQFYAYMTGMIHSDPTMAERLTVTKDNFSMMFFLLNEQDQIAYIKQMLEASKLNPMRDMMLLPAISSMFTNTDGTPISGITVTAETVEFYFSKMSQAQRFVLLSGMPASEMMPVPVAGLVEMSGDAMTSIYEGAAEKIKKLEIDENLFTMMLPQLSESEFAQIEKTLYDMAAEKDASLKSNLKKLGDAEQAKPASINFYAKDFESKDNVEAFIKSYNDAQTDESKRVQYTDLIGVLMSSISLIINVISYVLIAFVSISLVVSSIMIGIITYISVLERTKEIGVLRAIGASKRDISRVFNAETLIVGLAAGLIGILATVLLCLPINAIIHALSGIDSINAVLPWAGGVALVIISMLLTFVAGLIPSRLAAKKDPVEALRSE